MSRAWSTVLVVVATFALGTEAAGSGSSRVALDPSAASGDVGHALVLEGDGSVVLAGLSISRGGREAFALVRYGRGGAVDTSFGAHGIVLGTSAVGSAAVSAAAAQDDGKLVFAGSAYVSQRQSAFLAARYTTRGKLDARFGDAGKVLTTFAAPPRPGKFTVDSAEGLAPQRDGKIVVAGQTGNGIDSPQLAVARYTTTGALDPGFGTGGKVRTQLGPRNTSRVRAVAVQDDGKLVVVGSSLVRVGDLSESRFTFARFTRRGALDLHFGSGGRVVAPPIGYWDDASAVAIQGDGRIVATGVVRFAKRGIQLALVRLLPSGVLDAAFGTGGIVVTNFAVLGYDAALALQPDGKIVAACGLNGPRRFGVARYDVDGTLDAGFGDGGQVRTRFSSGAAAHAVVVQPDGKIVVGGSSGGDFALARYTTDGILDTRFGHGGIVTTPLGPAWPPPRSP